MNKVNEVMTLHSEFCNTETRVPDLLYILKKYNYEEIVIVDSKLHPIGIVKGEDVSDEAMKNILHPFDMKAEKLMTGIKATVKKDASVEECLKLMETNHLSVIPVVDEIGQCEGVAKKENLFIRQITNSYN